VPALKASCAGLVASALLLAGCGGGAEQSTSTAADKGRAAGDARSSSGPPSASGSGHATHASGAAEEPAAAPLRPGERLLDLAMPGGAYTPTASGPAPDQHRCFLLDPALANQVFVTGAEVLPGRRDIVHHAIVFRVEPDQVAGAEQADAGDPGTGWTCFGDSGVPDRSGAGAVASLDSAPWLSAWAPGGGESVFPTGTGVRLRPGSRLVLQVHYNLRGGAAPDDSGLRLRLRDGAADLEPLETMLLVAPVELPCAPGEVGRLCDRDAAVLDLMQRFGSSSGATVAGLQLLCDGNLARPRAGATQRCDRRVQDPLVVRAVAGHMHLLGRSIRVELNPGTRSARTLLDRSEWDFDDQRATPLRRPARVARGDVLRVTCTHDARLRGMLPALAEEEPRYVTWGEGTADEMCLGVLVYTRG
jgi:hypothetical protein